MATFGIVVLGVMLLATVVALHFKELTNERLRKAMREQAEHHHNYRLATGEEVRKLRQTLDDARTMLRHYQAKEHDRILKAEGKLHLPTCGCCTKPECDLPFTQADIDKSKGQLHSIEAFGRAVGAGVITDFDGGGLLAYADRVSDTRVVPSTFHDQRLPAWADGVWWFPKLRVQA